MKCQWFKEGIMGYLDIDTLNQTVVRLENKNKELVIQLTEALAKIKVLSTPMCSDVQPKKRKYNKKKQPANVKN